TTKPEGPDTQPTDFLHGVAPGEALCSRDSDELLVALLEGWVSKVERAYCAESSKEERRRLPDLAQSLPVAHDAIQEVIEAVLVDVEEGLSLLHGDHSIGDDVLLGSVRLHIVHDDRRDH
ncbi:hypothetical protein LTR53_019976, partial [Teratosphaeriaceae sp. CCFEE 6253]